VGVVADVEELDDLRVRAEPRQLGGRRLQLLQVLRRRLLMNEEFGAVGERSGQSARRHCYLSAIEHPFWTSDVNVTAALGFDMMRYSQRWQRQGPLLPATQHAPPLRPGPAGVPRSRIEKSKVGNNNTAHL